jgi:hypothetical protein
LPGDFLTALLFVILFHCYVKEKKRGTSGFDPDPNFYVPLFAFKHGYFIVMNYFYTNTQIQKQQKAEMEKKKVL